MTCLESADENDPSLSFRLIFKQRLKETKQ
jgi:hypothetical protein